MRVGAGVGLGVGVGAGEGVAEHRGHARPIVVVEGRAACVAVAHGRARALLGAGRQPARREPEGVGRRRGVEARAERAPRLVARRCGAAQAEPVALTRYDAQLGGSRTARRVLRPRRPWGVGADGGADRRERGRGSPRVRRDGERCRRVLGQYEGDGARVRRLEPRLDCGAAAAWLG